MSCKDIVILKLFRPGSFRKESNMKEPAFMKDIHDEHRKEYEKNKKLTVAQRLRKLREESNKVLHRV